MTLTRRPLPTSFRFYVCCGKGITALPAVISVYYQRHELAVVAF